VKVIEQATKAWDRTKNGKRYLDGVVVQIKITRQILEQIVKVEPNLQRSDTVYIAVEFVNEKAKELDAAVKDMAKSSGVGSWRVFLIEFIRGDARVENFDRLQRDLCHAQSILITSLVANPVSNTNIYHVNINAVDRLMQCFIKWEGDECAPPILQLIKERGTPVGDGSVWVISKEDLYAFNNESRSSAPKIERIIVGNELKDLALITGDVGKPGEAAPRVDIMRTEHNKLSGCAMVIGGPIAFEAYANTLTLRTALHTLQMDKE
jgi:hypothetical protein